MPALIPCADALKSPHKVGVATLQCRVWRGYNYHMTNLIPNPDELAAIAFNAYYFDDLSTYIGIAEMIANAAPASFHDMLADAIDDDIRDLLHNANDADLFPFVDDLSDNDADAFSAYLLDFDTNALTQLSSTIATLAIARAA